MERDTEKVSFIIGHELAHHILDHNEQARNMQHAGGESGESGAQDTRESSTARALALADAWDSRGSVLFVTVDDSVASVLLMADVLKPEAADTVAALKTVGVRPVLLTGDKKISAQRVASAGAPN